MQTVPIRCETIDAQTGEVVKVENATAFLVPPRPGACPTCGHYPGHPAGQPHALTLHYLWAFYGEHGRWPTWRDAVAHCAPAVRESWEKDLRARGKWTEPQGADAPR